MFTGKGRPLEGPDGWRRDVSSDLKEAWEDAAHETKDVKRPRSGFDRLYWVYVWVAAAICVYGGYCVVYDVPFFGLDIPTLKDAFREWISASMGW